MTEQPALPPPPGGYVESLAFIAPGQVTPAMLEAFQRALAEPFHPDEIQWKPVAFPRNRRDRALVVPVYDVRLVYDRLDRVVGPANWQISVRTLESGGVATSIGIRLFGDWVWKEDVGMVDRGDKTESATKAKGDASDGAKRAAALWGIGRCYWLVPKDDTFWVDYDDANKKILQTPRLPEFALPYGFKPSAQAAAKKPEQKPTQPAGLIEPPPEGRPFAPAEVRQRLDALYERLKADDALQEPSKDAVATITRVIESAFDPSIRKAARESVLMYFFAEPTTAKLKAPHLMALWRYLSAKQDASHKWAIPGYVADELRAIYAQREEQF